MPAALQDALLLTPARARPDLAGEAMVRTLAWTAWLPGEDRAGCLTELLAHLRAGAETGELRPFGLALEAWRSTAVIRSDPAVLAELQRSRTSAELSEADSDVAAPGVAGTG